MGSDRGLSAVERLQAAVARALVRLPRFALRLVAGPPIVIGGQELDLQIQAVLVLARLLRPPRPHAASVAAARHELELSCAVFPPPAPPLAGVDELSIPSPAGPRPARLYRPRGAATPAPALLFFHGGGFVEGSLDTHDGICRVLCARARCAVVSLDYRLAPEHPFPAAIEDGAAAFRHLVGAAPALGLDPRRLAVGGDSAGGNLAAVLCQTTRDEALRPCFQLLVYPALDMTLSLPSITTYARGFFLEKETMEWFRSHYLPAGTSLRDPLASPLHGDCRGLPPALVMTAGFDPLRDEGEAYAGRLREAGVPVEYRLYPSLFHGFLGAGGGIDAARAPLEDAALALGRALGTA